ncbi:MAG: tetraacyldisaccharide 4'-kinase [Rudaea sp.]
MFDERELQEVWYAGKPPSRTLRALAAIYAAAVAARRRLYDSGFLHTTRLRMPVVVVGNLTVGGTGKTPLVIALVEALRARGRRPGVVSRGHGADVRGTLMLSAASSAAECGDEPVLIHRNAAVPVAVGRDRVAAARLLLERSDCDVIIADDGLQHYALARDVEICVVDGARRFGNGRMLPAGPLREPPSRLQTVDLHVCNSGVAQPGEVPMTLVADIAQALSGPAGSPRSLASFAGRRVHAVAGIGHPLRFFSMLRAAGLVVDEHPFADHHPFVAADLEYGDDAPVLMTQKDAIKCAAFARANFWQVPVRAELPSTFFDDVAARISADR